MSESFHFLIKRGASDGKVYARAVYRDGSDREIEYKGDEAIRQAAARQKLQPANSQRFPSLTFPGWELTTS